MANGYDITTIKQIEMLREIQIYEQDVIIIT